MPSCDHCGQNFGNEGACATHELSCDEKPDETEADAPKAVKPAEPADPDPQPPANQQPAQGGDPVATGAKLGEALSGISSNDPAKQDQARGELLSAAGAAIASVGKTVAQRRQQNRENAKNTDSVEKVEEYPTCPECGGQITGIPDDGEFTCPHCEAILRAP